MNASFLDSIIGQETIVGTLRHAWQEQRLSHAYRFSGPPGCGKQTTADCFTRELIGQDDPAGKVLLDAYVHPDTMTIAVPEQRTQISVEQIIRELNPWLYTRPVRAQHKIAIIKEADRLSSPAANALLHILEEPPEYAILILISERDGMLETIVSRCQNLRFLPLHDDDLLRLLEHQGIEVDKAAALLPVAQGNAGIALDLAVGNTLADYEEHALALLDDVASHQRSAIFRAAEALERQPLLIYFIEMLLRDFYLYRQSSSSVGLLLPVRQSCFASWPLAEADQALTQMRQINRLKTYVQGAANKQVLSTNLAWHIWNVFHKA